ncbi:MAG: hypothetical protein ABEJ72_06775 [Candidatus Aenigmatarchaeota archaeon]
MPHQVEASSLRKGSYVILDGEPCEVRGTSKSSPGKHGSAKVKIKARGVFDDKDRHVTKPGDKMMMSPDVAKKIGQGYLRDRRDATTGQHRCFRGPRDRVPGLRRPETGQGSQEIDSFPYFFS